MSEKADKPAFSFKDVDDIPKKTIEKGSRYDAIIDQFLASDKTKVAVEVPDKKGSYLASQLAKRMVVRASEKLDKKIEVTSVKNICYLRKL